MWKTTIKGLMAHKLRMALTALAVVLGVGFIAGTYVLTDTMNRTFDNLFIDATAGVDVYVQSASSFESQAGGSRAPFSEDLLDDVRSVEGVEAAAGTVTGYAQIVDKSGEAITPNGPPALGVSWPTEQELTGTLTLRSGAPPQDSGDVVIDAATAAKAGFRVGDQVTILFVGRPRDFTLSGITGFGSADNLAGATLAAFELGTAQRVLDRIGQFDAIEVAGEDGVSPAELSARIQAVLPPRLEAETGQNVADQQSSALQENLSFFNTALLVFAAVALFVGAFIIYNTFSITVAQRTKEFALLRALGASGTQVMVSVIVEALLVGLVASVVGLGAGILIALGLQALLSAFGIDLPSTGFQLLPRTVVVSLLVGTVVSLVSSILPARRAARTSPMEALRAAAPGAAGWSTRRTIAGALVTAAGGAILGLGLFGDPGNPAAAVGAGALVVFIGVAVLTPLFAGPLASLLGLPLARLFNVPGSLARHNAARNPRRTASTAAALMIGLALVGLVGIFAASLKASTNQVLDESLKADFMISSTSFAGPAPFSPLIASEAAELPEIEAASPIRLGQWRRTNGQLLFVSAIDASTFSKVADIEVSQGSLASLEDDGVFLFARTADDLGLGIGDELAMEFAASGVQDMTVKGLFENKSLTNTDYLISLRTWEDNFPERVDSTVLAKAAPGVPPQEARSALDEVVERFPNVEVQDQSEIKQRSAAQVDSLLGLVTALLGLALVIALLGITNTLALSVFERTRELGLLRAVGMSRRQARSMIRWEAMIIAVIGALLGLAIGIFFGWALVEALADEGITELAIPGGQLLLYVVLAALAGVAAAVPPARRAARLNVLEAIGTE
jgi:putative ABC transport system permease protein